MASTSPAFPSTRRAHFEVQEPSSAKGSPDVSTGRSSSGPDHAEGSGSQQPSGTASQALKSLKQAATTAYWWAFTWADPHLRSLRSLKITLRCAIALEACFIFFLSGPSRTLTSTSKVFEGSYLVPLMAFFLPPSDSMSVYLEKTLVAATMMTTAWAYDCFVIWISWLTRHPDRRFPDQMSFENYLQTQGYASMGDAQHHLYADLPFMDPRSASVAVVFLAVGLAILVWFRGQMLAGTAHVVSTIAVILQLALPVT